MKAKRLFLKNYEEHAQVQNLGLKQKPQIETLEIDFYFELRCVTEMFKTIDGSINVMLGGREILLKYEPKVYQKLVNHLE